MAFYFSCCGAGTAADTEYVTQLISSHIKLHSLSTGRQVMSEAVEGAVSQKKIIKIQKVVTTTRLSETQK